MSAIERVRREVLADTGVDFGRYRTVELASRLDVWGLGARVGSDLAVSTGAGAAVAVVIVAVSSLTGWGAGVSWLVAVGATAVGAGVTALVGASRLARRASREVDTVFDLAAGIADQVSSDLETVAGSLDSVVRGLVIVAAVPLAARVASKRFLVLAPVVRHAVELVAGRVLDRTLPSMPVTARNPGPVLAQISQRMSAGRSGATRRIGTAARWGVLPFRIWGVAVGTLGAAVLAVSFVLGALS